MGRAYEVRKASMAKTNAAKAKVYSRFGKEIYIAAKTGEPSPEMNVELARVIEKAKAAQVPSDVIKRAIEKAKGGDDQHYDEIRYEGFGPGNATLIVDCLTDNLNRTFGEVRNCFTKTNSKIGVNGSVMHSYDSMGLISFAYDGSADEMLEILLMADIDVNEVEKNDNEVTVLVNPTELYKAKEAIETQLDAVKFDGLELTLLPHEEVVLTGEDLERFNKLIAMLDEVDDVQYVSHNVVFS